jgi:hypothetical protein
MPARNIVAPTANAARRRGQRMRRIT